MTTEQLKSMTDMPDGKLAVTDNGKVIAIICKNPDNEPCARYVVTPTDTARRNEEDVAKSRREVETFAKAKECVHAIKMAG